jgi:hypothetical protein
VELSTHCGKRGIGAAKKRNRIGSTLERVNAADLSAAIARRRVPPDYLWEGTMTAYNVVRFRVKPGMEEAFIASQRKSIEGNDMAGGLSAALVKTGDRQYCFVGRWENFDQIVAARPQMIGFLDEVREYLEDLGGGLGVTDPVSGPALIERTS